MKRSAISKKTGPLLWPVMTLAVILSGCSSAGDTQPEVQPSGSDGPASEANEVAAPGDGPAGQLVVRAYAGMRSTDPFIDDNASTWQVLRHIYEPLVTVDSGLIPQPLIAEEWTHNEDATEWTFKLREGLQFHDGSEVTADDVAYSLQYFHDNSSFDAELGDVASIEARDPATVIVTLNEPRPSLVDDIASPIGPVIVPEGSAENDGLATNPIGTGPFQVGDFQPEVRATLSAFEGYNSVDAEPDGLAGRREALVETIEFVLISEDAAAVAALETGEVDVDFFPPVSEAERLDSLPNVNLVTSPGSRWMAGSFNLASDGWIQDPLIRQAITHAMNPEDFIETTFFGFARFVGGYTAPEFPYYVEGAHDYWPYSYDPERAKELLEEAGYDGSPIEIIAGGPAYQEANAIIMQQQAAAVGLNLQVNKLEHATFLDRGVNGNYEMNSAGGTFHSTPAIFYVRYYCGFSLRYGYCNPEYDATFDEAVTTVDREERYRLFAELERMIKDDAVILPFALADTIYAHNDRVAGLEADPWDSFKLWNVSVED